MKKRRGRKMIDVHCHIIPGVDDGPDRIEKSIEMLRMAESDGIRKIIATPHRNHPLGYPNCNVEESFEALKAAAIEARIDVDLYLGAEQYIGKEEVFKAFEAYPLFGSRYLLVEFKTHIDLESLLTIIYELRVKGFWPIVAHVEMYPTIIHNDDSITRIKAEGGLIQITASSLTGAVGKKIAAKLMNAVRRGQVDFIASDAHGLNQRPPILSVARRSVQKNATMEIANRIFSDNPTKLMLGEEIVTPKKLQMKSTHRRAYLIASVITVLALVFAMGMRMFPGSSAEVVVASEIMESDDAIEVALPIIVKPATDKAPDVQGDKWIQVEPVHRANTPSEPSKTSIEMDYEQRLRMLKTEYEVALDAYVDQIIKIKSTVNDQEERNRKIDAVIDAIVRMEQESDNTVYALLYDMQNALEKEKYTVEQVQIFRDEYNDIKETTKMTYMEKIKN
jgi:protein-tyrosine phosphatase